MITKKQLKNLIKLPYHFIKTMKNLFKVIALITVGIIAIISCVKEDTPEKKETSSQKITISSFNIEDNTADGIFTDTQLNIDGDINPIISNHGTVVLQNNSLFDMQELGELNTNSYKSIISKGLIKGETYTVFPFIYHNNNYIYGDTISFISNVYIDVIIDEMTPKNGFVYDTITIKGHNFCKSYNRFQNGLLLSGVHHSILSESDTLITAIISPFINSSTLNPVLKTCNLETALNESFSIDAPVLDSISSKETYVGDHLLIYGKNFHSYLSEVWINGIETKINKNRLDIDTLEVTIPKGLPAGLLDVKIKVLDKIIEKKNRYQSTTPYITQLDKHETGFLDVITITGNYFKQPNQEIEVIIGGRKQRILSYTKTEIRVIIDAYFDVLHPKFLLKIGDFEMEAQITMLPPQIESVDKEFYHLQDDEVVVKTKYFLGYPENVKVGTSGLAVAEVFDNVDVNGNLTIPLNKWLNNNNFYPHYAFESIGEIKIDIHTAYGSASKKIKIFKPVIQKINKTKFFRNEYIEIDGLDFGYADVSQIYINDILVSNAHNSSYSLRNYSAKFIIPGDLPIGQHKLKIVCGGQPTNIIDFEVKSITVNASNILPATGTRKDIYSIGGSNLENNYYSILADINISNNCTIVSTSENKVEFKLPYFWPLENNIVIKLRYGDQYIDAGEIQGLEPFEILKNYEVSPTYSTGSSSFEYNGELFFLNNNGIYKYNILANNWNIFERNMPVFEYGFSNNYQNYVSVFNDKIYFPYGGSFYIYDLKNKQWLNNLNFPEGSNLKRGIIHNGELFYVNSDENNALVFYKYNFSTLTKVKLNQPNKLPSNQTADIFYYNNNKIFMDLLDGNIMVYEIETDSWEDIGHPRTPFTYFYANNLYLYKNVLYLSGGEGNQGPEYKMYSYDFNSKEWSENTPMLRKLRNHAVIGNGDYLYIGLGTGQYRDVNPEMMRYNIVMDPH